MDRLLVEREEIGRRMQDIAQAEAISEEMIIKANTALTELHECICDMEEIE